MSKKEGQSLIDILIGSALIALGIGFAAILVFGGQSVLIDRENAAVARALAKSALDGASAAVKSNWQVFADGNYGISFASGTWSLVGTSTQTENFTTTVNIKTLNSNEKEIKSTVSWPASPQRVIKVEFVTVVTNWEEAAASGGDTGGGGLSGNWQNPKTLGTVDLGPGNAATDLDVINKIVYMSAQASAASKPDFFIIDATDGQNPVIKSSLDVGSKGLNAIDAAGHYAYGANQLTTNQLVVIDISNINNPSVVAFFTLPGVSGSGAVGNAIFYNAGKVYIGTKNASGPEFHIVDVSNPANPVSLGSYEIGGDVGAIYVKNNIAYVANSTENELKILDVNNPSNIRLLGQYDAPGDSEDGKSLDLVGNTLYLGRLVGGNHTNHHEFHIIDVTTSSSPNNLGSKDLAADLNDLKIKDGLAFFATGDSNREFQIWNVSNPQNISLWASYNFPQVATGIDYENNFIYVSVRSNDALRIITSQ